MISKIYWAETAVRAFSNNWEVNFNWSKVLYEKCNSYYDEIEIPTDIVYYDEVRRADSCEGLGLLHDCANLAILNQKQLMLVDKIKSQANKKILAKVGKKNKKEVKGWVDTRVNIWTEEPNFFQQLGSSKSRKEALNSFIAEGIQKFK